MKRSTAARVVFLVLVGLTQSAFGVDRTFLSLWASGWQGEGHAARVSSYDRTGANNDAIQILPGQTATLADINGPGVIRRIWTTTNVRGPVGRTLVLRMYWDGSKTPAVEVPYGDFFGVGNGLEAEVHSFPITVVSGGRSRNCWWPMPFAKGFRMTVTNEGPEPHGAFYYHIDYLALDRPPKTPLRFHAQYRQAYPADSPDDYTLLEATGKGQYMGVVMSVDSTKPNWWGEGDETIAADDFEPLHGTGTEEYFGDAWGMHEHSALWHGSPVCEGYDNVGLRTSMYRFHILDPIPFKKRLRVTIEHGTQNDRADNLSSVAFWYQVPPAAPFPPLPAVDERLVGGERTAFVQKRLWQLATGDVPGAREELARIAAHSGNEENLALARGLTIYFEEKQNPTVQSMAKLDEQLAKLRQRIEAMPESERYHAPKIDLPTDDDALVPSPVVVAYRTLERARHDLARRLAKNHGLHPGDEIVVEVRDSLGNLMPAPTYSESPDFTSSYAKVDDCRLMGSGARFTYGNADPSWARFTPEFPRSGRYEVFVIFSYGANATDTRYEVRHADGTTIVPLEQRGRPGTSGRNNAQWHSLGTFRFEKGQNVDKGSVTLNAAPGKAVAHEKFEYRAYADAVRFVYAAE